MTTTPPTHVNTTLTLAELTVGGSEIVGVAFEGCHIVGPGIIQVGSGSTLSGSSFEGDPEDVLWPLGPDMTAPVGLVTFRDCTFANCTFQRVNLAFPPAQEDQVRQGFGLPTR